VSGPARPGGPRALVVGGGRPLRGKVRVPGDKSISHRALLLAARGRGTSVLRGLSDGDDVSHTADAMEAVGVDLGGQLGPEQEMVVRGAPERLAEPERVLDVGNSGTAMRLLAGWLAGFGWLCVLEGDASVNQRPMDRVIEPLTAMGARVDGRGGGRLPPLVIRGSALHGIDYTPPMASAQVKSAVLLAGLRAEGDTVVREPLATRAHTEEMLAACGASIDVVRQGAGQVVTLRPSHHLEPFQLEVPGDPSAGAYWVVAGCVVPGSEVVVEDLYVGPGRAGFLDVLIRMGADLSVEHRDATTADIVVRHGCLRGTDIEAGEVPGLVDEIPVLAVAAALADGVTTVRGAGELRVKESDRLATVTSELRALGGQVEATSDGLVITGRGSLSGGTASSHGDHRIAMAMAVAGMVARGRTRVEGWEAVDTSYPTFEAQLEALA